MTTEHEVEGLSEKYIRGLSEYYAKMMFVWHSEGGLSRESLVLLFSDYKYFVPTDEEPNPSGTFSSTVGWALAEGYIDQATYLEILGGVIRNG